jgi:hypothetical protein
VGEWIPEPLPDRREWIAEPPDVAADPADRVTLDESVNMAFLVVLESMTPADRVALILHDVFGYAFAEVGQIVGRTPPACRQLASSGRRRARQAQIQIKPAVQPAAVVKNFKNAWETKDIDALIRILDPDATAVVDGGGLVSAVGPVHGSEQIARVFADIASRAPALNILERAVNGQPGLVTQRNGIVETVLAFSVRGNLITNIWAVCNPEKLRPWITH